MTGQIGLFTFLNRTPNLTRYKAETWQLSSLSHCV